MLPVHFCRPSKKSLIVIGMLAPTMWIERRVTLLTSLQIGFLSPLGPSCAGFFPYCFKFLVATLHVWGVFDPFYSALALAKCSSCTNIYRTDSSKSSWFNLALITNSPPPEGIVLSISTITDLLRISVHYHQLSRS